MALTKVINDAGRKLNVLKESDKLTGEDVREGITAVVSVKLVNAQFESQTKDKLNNSSIRAFVNKCVTEHMSTFLEENPAVARELVLRCITAQESTRRGEKRARVDQKKGDSRKHDASRQACRLFGQASRTLRNLYRRGRLGRRHGKAGQR